MNATLDKVVKKHVVLTALTGLAVVLLMLTITYGLYQTNHENTTDQEISLGDFDVDLTSNSGQITLANLNPGVENSTTYTFTTSNSGDYVVKYNVYFTDNTTTFLADSANASTYSNYTQIISENYQYIEYKLDNGEYKPLTDVYDSSSSKFTIITGRLQPNISYNHTVKFKVSSNAPNELQGSILTLNITMDATVAEEVGTDTIMNLVAGESTSSTDVITKTAPQGATCTNTLAYDGTVDNNLRFVGTNPCNYVTFNEESPTSPTSWILINTSTNEPAAYNKFDSESACQSFITENSLTEITCQNYERAIGGWRIIGVMNNIDDGTGKLETRLKLMRNDRIGKYSLDTSASDINSGKGIPDWSQADLMTELNGDYLDTTLTENTLWYDGQNNQKTSEYDYTIGLKASTQELIANAKWHLGGLTYTNDHSDDFKPSNMYNFEKKAEVWGSLPGQTCNDGACPRATQWTGKVALIHPSDYALSTAGGQSVSRNACINTLSARNNTAEGHWGNVSNTDCSNNDWIKPIYGSMETLGVANNYVNSSLTVYRKGSVHSMNPFHNEPVYPVVYLKTNVKIIGGNGSAENPYTLG